MHGRQSMTRLQRVSFIMTALALTLVPAARGELPNSTLRRWGIGWSDGYHSHTACPPKRHVIPHKSTFTAFPMAAPKSEPIPWWKVPAAPTETYPGEVLPTPASLEAGTSRKSPTSGPSLFRQPGEGSSLRF